MVEQTDSCKRHYHVVFVAGCDDILITNRSARLCDVLNTTLMRTLDVVAEGEECIGSKGNTGHL